MAFVLKKQPSWSDKGLSLAIWATLASVFLALAEGILRGPIGYAHVSAASVSMFFYWCYGLRNVTETLIYAGTIVFIGGKFLENRTTLTLGFETLDSSQISLKGPDDNNIVWVGHRYGTRLEAEAIAATIESRLKESAAA